MDEEFFTVSELNQFIKNVIQSGFPQAIWVCGEIQNYERSKNKKHVFFEIVEKDPDSKDVKAKIDIVIFAGMKTQIKNILKQSENAFDLRDDIEVKFLCDVDFYVPSGRVNLIVRGIDPAYTLGKLAQEKQRLIALLKEKGILDKNKQIALPAVALNIGLITSDNSAAYNDFLSELQKSGYAFCVYLRNTLMQGKKAEKDTYEALGQLEKIKQLDVIVVTRGGGSIAELSCFDSELVAKKIAKCPLPVLSGIGHEINITITDLAAHTHAKTPTAIAQFLVQRIQDFLRRVEDLVNQVIDIAQYKLDGENQTLKNLALQMQNSTRQYLKDYEENILRLSEFIKYRPVELLKNQNKNLGLNKDLLLKTIKTRFQNDQLKLKGYQKIIDVLHPINTLRRGFSITRTSQGKVMKRTSDTSPQEDIVTEVIDGKIESRVTTIKRDRISGNHEMVKEEMNGRIEV